MGIGGDASHVAAGTTVIITIDALEALKKDKEMLQEKLVKDADEFKKLISNVQFELKAERLATLDMKKAYEKTLNDKDKNYEFIIQMKNQDVNNLQDKNNDLIKEIKGLEGDLKKEGEEFDLLTEALADKETEINKHVANVLNLKEVITVHEKEQDRLKVIIEKQKKRIDTFKPPVVHEVCLSARSYSDEMLIQLRDEDIEGKGKQIDMLTVANNKLLINLDTIEDSLEKLQRDILDKNVIISKLESQLRGKDAQIEKQEQTIKVLSGREAAMEIAAQQNSKLLQLLQQQEGKMVEVEHESMTAKEALKEMKTKYVTVLKEAAEYEALSSKYNREVSMYKGQLEDMKVKTKKELEDLSQHAGEVTRASYFKEQTTMEELRTRKETQYVRYIVYGHTFSFLHI